MLGSISAVWHVQRLSIRAPSFEITAGIRQANLGRGVETHAVHSPLHRLRIDDDDDLSKFKQASNLRDANNSNDNGLISRRPGGRGTAETGFPFGKPPDTSLSNRPRILNFDAACTPCLPDVARDMQLFNCMYSLRATAHRRVINFPGLSVPVDPGALRCVDNPSHFPIRHMPQRDTSNGARPIASPRCPPSHPRREVRESA